ncbi:helix-turn-helix domain-containing protein [Streptomyces uncialis]|uniref:DNA-binding protein n=1 Tax=Streptomyces uncialis TaxID=1048205 RepID=A0A1Q4V9D1_9ACTN|nr:helix-turn-helix domain-containing protein [Streptomyces uncialis]OKH94407.1 DNA-binding protein [Streptomyces uncialis]
MAGTEAGADDSRGAFSLDTTTPGPLPRGFASFRREWETQVGDGFPLPTFSPATTGDFRVEGRVAKVRDAAITDVNCASAIRTAALGDVEDQVRMWVVQRGAWTLGGPGDEHTVSAGQFLLRHVGRPSHFATAPHTTAKIVVLPATMLKPLLGNQIVAGSLDSAEVRLLVAHTNMIHANVTDLGPAGVRAAHSALIELAKAVAGHRFDDKEPLLASALAQAAKDLADSRLTDPSLSSSMLASELSVSVRTLQRAFATGGEPVTAYIRRRRLEEARLALTAPFGRLNISELAAHWQFADSSHFIRAFKTHYGQTPTDHAGRARSRKE